MTTAATHGGRRSRLLQKRRDPQVRANGITAIVPKTLTSNSLTQGRFAKQDIIYVAADNEFAPQEFD